MSRLTAGTAGAAPFGVFPDVRREVYDELMAEQLDVAVGAFGRLRWLLYQQEFAHLLIFP